MVSLIAAAFQAGNKNQFSWFFMKCLLSQTSVAITGILARNASKTTTGCHSAREGKINI